MFEDLEGAPLAFSVDLMAKDLDLIQALAREVDAPVAQGERNREILDRALAAGFSGRDMSWVAEYRGGRTLAPTPSAAPAHPVRLVSTG